MVRSDWQIRTVSAPELFEQQAEWVSVKDLIFRTLCSDLRLPENTEII